MFRHKIWLSISMVIIAAMLLTACQPQAAPTAIIKTVVVEQEAKEVVVVATPEPAAPSAEPVETVKVLRMVSGESDLPSIDPPMVTDMNNVQVVEETSVGLVRQNVQTSGLEPGMAKEWKISDDGLTYTFTLRDDVPWVRYDGNEVVKVQDCDGKDRMVTAEDFKYGILRTLNPATAADYAYVLTPAIVGAAEFNEGKIEDAAKVGVTAIDAKTLEIKFKNAAVYNLNLIGLWVAHAMPKWIIEGDDCTEAKGDRWTETGSYQGYGPYTLKEWVHDSYLTVIKNPFWPGQENIPQSKIDELTWFVLPASANLSEYEAGNMEISTIPGGDFDRVMSDATLKNEVYYTSTLGTEFYSFNTQIEPTNDVRVRQALSLAIDRDALVKNVVKSGKVAPYFTNPGVTGAPDPAKYPDLGVKFDPAKAKELLDSYLKEKGITADKLSMTLMFNTSESHKKNAEAIQAMWMENLGINVTLVNQERKVFMQSRKAGKEAVYRSSWVQDYPDAHNFLYDTFAPNGGYADVLDWSGPAYDKFVEIIKAAAMEQDPDKRMQMYADAEKILVVDEAVLTPLYWYATPELVKPYVKYYPSKIGYERYEYWDIQK